jgi:predicted ABC-type ATPase
MPSHIPHCVLIAGPNGSGKLTAATALIRDHFGVLEYVNADVIAQGLSGFNSEAVAFQAGRLMLRRVDQLTAQRTNFAIETTLASRSLLPRLRQMQSVGYQTHLLFLWLPSPDLAISRVALRVRQGGHDVPANVIRRRFRRGLSNLVHLYLPCMDS